MNVVRFGVACCKTILRDELRYTGEPEFRRAIEVCERLVFSFGELDPRMLLLALMRNLWRAEYRFSEVPRVNLAGPAEGSDIIEDFCGRLRRRCNRVLDAYKRKLPINAEHHISEEWFENWCRSFPGWFWAVHRSFRDYFLKPLEEPTSQWKDRLRMTYKELDRLHPGGQSETLKEWLERAYMMEAAVLLSTLTELPFEPGKARRKRLHDNYLSLYREIRRYLPNGAMKARIVQEVDRAFRDIETEFDLPREAEWWGE